MKNKNTEKVYIGMDIGSTTIKCVVTTEDGETIYTRYERHEARIVENAVLFMNDILRKFGDLDVSVTITGSIGMGIAERFGLPFVQEVVCATKYINKLHPEIATLIDIGGEDAKVVFFHHGQSPDLRMNGNCAGGTGSFIDQMAILLGVDVGELSNLALGADRIYPIASRCGVFCKTDIQNLLAKNVSRKDIAASIFHAVAVQTVVTLSHGQDIGLPLLFCGGPLTFIPALRKAFCDYLEINEDDVLLPTNSHLIPAWGASIASEQQDETMKLSGLLERLSKNEKMSYKGSHNLPPLFNDKEEWKAWQDEKLGYRLPYGQLQKGKQEVTIGVDSGSTTTKIVVLDMQGRALFTYYAPNNGNPIGAVQTGLKQLLESCKECGSELVVRGSCSTGYGEDLIKAAFGFQSGIIETIAHFLAAKKKNPNVSFILDIGGQDMKAVFVDDGIINRIEINEACSSGCGTFIETFAKTMNYKVEDFAHVACLAKTPCDLGTRCTVFMNSKVKQVLREGAQISDIAAGLSYSVIKNCLHKVLKIKDKEDLGKQIVVQGGTMRNDAVVRAFEQLLHCKVIRSDCPELMGAYGCALHAREKMETSLSLEDLMASSKYETRELHCKGCENHCQVNRYKFQNGNSYYSGNRCERIFSNHGKNVVKGINLHKEKDHYLFDREQSNVHDSAMKIGIPRVLNIFEEYPFWFTLFDACGFKVVLSDASTYEQYEKGVKSVMSDNICFPAKLVHGHILNLQEKGVDRIFMPYVIYEKNCGGENSFNCPIVTGYSDVIKSSMKLNVPLDSPVISFRDHKGLVKELKAYLKQFGISRSKVKDAVEKALQAQNEYEINLVKTNKAAYNKAKEEGRMIILLAGRPYHTDPLIQHKLSDMVTDMGADCLTVDIARDDAEDLDDVHFISQWSYPEQVLKAAKWAALQDEHVQFMQLTSFGCGPDAFLTDEIRTLLQRHGKTLTLLKIDDVCNVGSLKLRVRSAVDSLRLKLDGDKCIRETVPFCTTPAYTEEVRKQKQKIIVPYFTDFISPLIPSFMKLAGYDVDVLPMSNHDSDNYGLKYANNEVCYPATLIVGDIVSAFKEGRYDPDTTTVLMTQTGGQCRASNYISLIKKALLEAGYDHVPVISMTLNKELLQNQPAFKVDIKKILPIIITGILYSDAISKMYYAAVARETKVGKAREIRDRYIERAKKAIEENNPKELFDMLEKAAGEFDNIVEDKHCQRVGVVGEIFLKFNNYAQRGITNWFVKHQIEVEPPLLCNFFLQFFVNEEVNDESHVEASRLPKWLMRLLYKRVWYYIKKVNKACQGFRYFQPFDDIYSLAKDAKPIVSLSAQFGEGWLLPAEVVSMADRGINHVISLQPFGCIANHIVAKGVEKRIKKLYPDLNYLTLDFDGGVSEVNVTNRLLLFANDLIDK